MNWIENLSFFCAISFGLLVSVNSEKKIADGVQSIRITKAECWTSGITLKPDYKCYVKAYSRKYATLNVVWLFNRPLSDFKVNITMDYKYVTTYRQMLKTPTADFCSLMGGKTLEIVAFEMLFNLVRDSGVGDILHPCPYNDVIAYNFSMIGESFYSVFPSGDYRFVLNLSDSIDPKIVVLRLYTTVASPIKTSF